MARLARIQIYPFKSFDPETVNEARLLPSGALAHDRRYALLDRQGEWVNGKRTPAVHRLRTRFDAAAKRLSIRLEGTDDEQSFHVDNDREALVNWLAAYFEIPLELIENEVAGYPDDTESPGPTVISRATLEVVASWFSGLTVEDVRNRFRANLEIDDVEPFWEDRLVEWNSLVRFQIGRVTLSGSNPCQRCIVPTRSPTTGEIIHGFSKQLARHRQQALPDWAPVARFDHYYRLATNTRPVAGQHGLLRVGDEVRILDGV